MKKKVKKKKSKIHKRVKKGLLDLYKTHLAEALRPKPVVPAKLDLPDLDELMKSDTDSCSQHGHDNDNDDDSDSIDGFIAL